MIQAAAALSTDADTARAGMDAARQVVEGLGGERPDWCVVFVTTDHAPRLDSLLESVSGAVGTPYVCGCSASGVLVGGRELERGPAVGVLGVRSGELSATPFLFHEEGRLGHTAGERLGRRFENSRGSRDVVLVWPDPFHVRPDRMLQGIQSVLGPVRVIGGAASSLGNDGDTYQFSGTEFRTDAVSGLRLRGGFRCVVGVTQGCHPLGEPVRVTRAHDHMILEVEGRSPLDVLRERVPEKLLENLDAAFDFLFVGLLPESEKAAEDGTPRPDEYVIRNIVDADPDTGVLVISDRVREGGTIVFALREASSARDDMRRMLAEVRGEAGGAPYRFGLYFNCRARGRSLYGETGVDATLLREALPGVPLLGFFSNAEFAPLRGVNQLLTYTGVLLLIGDER